MKTNSLFDSKRFGRLIAYDMRINGMANLLKLAAFILIAYLYIIMQMRQSPYNFLSEPGELITVTQLYQNNGNEHATQIWCNDQGYTASFTTGLIFLIVFIGTSFTVMKEKTKRTLFLQLPASTLEKYLYTFLLRVVVGFGLYLLVYWIAAQLARLTYEHIPFGNLSIYYKDGMLIKPEVFNYGTIFTGGTEDKLILPFALLSLASFLFACPLFFRKLQLLKTIFILFAGLFLMICLSVLCTFMFYPGEVQGFNLTVKEVWLTNTFNNQTLAVFLWSCLSWPFFLLIGYFRLKESKL